MRLHPVATRRLAHLLLLLSISGCDLLPDFGGDAADGGDVEDGGPAATPGSAEVDVPAGGSVVLDGPGLTLKFPEGGRGTITVTPRPADDALLPSARAFEVAWNGDARVQVVLRRPTADAHARLFAYGNAPGILEAGPPRAQRWAALPAESDDGTLVTYDLPLPVAQALNPEATQVVYAAVEAPRQEQDKYLEAIGRGQLNSLLASMPESLADVARARHEQLGLEFAFEGPSGGSAYSGFSWGPLQGTKPKPVLTLRIDANIDVVAHEMGHYLTHLIAGDAAYRAIEDAAPDENHGLGVPYPPRATITEDYAYFAEYVLGFSRPCDAPRTILGTIDPRTTDVPSMEGLSCVLMALVGTPGVEWPDWERTGRVVGGGLASGVAFQLFRSGATGADALYTAAQDLSEDTDWKARLSAAVESAGWSYRALGVIADSEGNPCPGCLLAPYDRFGDLETAKGVTTDATGAFVLPRLGPGDHRIGVRPPDGITTQARTLSIPHTTPTTGTFTVAGLRLDNDLLDLQSTTNTSDIQLDNRTPATLVRSARAVLRSAAMEPLPWLAPNAYGWLLRSWKDSAFEIAVDASLSPLSGTESAGDMTDTITVDRVTGSFTVPAELGIGTPDVNGKATVLGPSLSWAGRRPSGSAAEVRIGVRVDWHIDRVHTGSASVRYDMSSVTNVGVIDVLWR